MNIELKNKEGNKKISIILVLRALEECSDAEHPIRQVHLAKMVNDLGGVLNIPLWCDRKTIARNIDVLKVAGYDIRKIKGKGVYLEGNHFTASEREKIVVLIEKSDIDDTEKKTILKKIEAQNVHVSSKKSDWEHIIAKQ